MNLPGIEMAAGKPGTKTIREPPIGEHEIPPPAHECELSDVAFSDHTRPKKVKRLG